MYLIYLPCVIDCSMCCMYCDFMYCNLHVIVWHIGFCSNMLFWVMWNIKCMHVTQCVQILIRLTWHGSAERLTDSKVWHDVTCQHDTDKKHKMAWYSSVILTFVFLSQENDEILYISYSHICSKVTPSIYVLQFKGNITLQ